MGTARLVVCWTPLGHPVRATLIVIPLKLTSFKQHDEPGLARDMLVSTRNFNRACDTLLELSIITSFVMGAFQQADPEQHKRLGRVYNWRVNRLASQKAMGAIDPGMWFEGRELQFNRYSLAHFDTQDPHWGWAIIIYYGTFESCTLEFRQLKVKVTLRPRDMVMFRGRDVLHEVKDWIRGERHLLVHFTHSSLWNQAKVECHSDPAVWVTCDN